MIPGTVLCTCRGGRASGRLSARSGVPVDVTGWVCVHCGRGRYLNGRCSECRVHVPRAALIPVGANRRDAPSRGVAA